MWRPSRMVGGGGCSRQSRRLVPFLPAALVVYLVLHYLVYQPDIGGDMVVSSYSSGVPGQSNHTDIVVETGTNSTKEVRVVRVTSSSSVSSVSSSLDNTIVNISQPIINSTNLSASKDPSAGTVPVKGTPPSNSSKNDLNKTDPAVSKDKAVHASSANTVHPANVEHKDVSPPSSPSPSKAESKSPPPAAAKPSPPKPEPKPKAKSPTKKVPLKKSSLAIDHLHGSYKVRQRYQPGFAVPHEDMCPNNGRDLKVLVFITTAPDHSKHRAAIRQTWGHFALRRDVVMVFIAGRTALPHVQAAIDVENEQFGDIIQTNSVDHYGNLTLKTTSMFEWIKTHCSEVPFILKTDDDMYINMPLLFAFIDSKKSEKRVLYGRLAKGWQPVRNKKSKYYVDKSTYSKTTYPDFVTGPAYLFTSDIVDDMYRKLLETDFFFLEDVLTTGIVGEFLKIRRIGDSRFKNSKIKLSETCKLMQTISIHMVKYEEQFDIYKRTLDGKTKCKVK